MVSVSGDDRVRLVSSEYLMWEHQCDIVLGGGDDNELLCPPHTVFVMAVTSGHQVVSPPPLPPLLPSQYKCEK